MYNKAILIARMCADPELKQTGNGTYVTGFTVAVDRRMSKEKKADFINIQAWRQQAEFVCKYFHKGDAIGIEGSIQTRNYEDKNGNKRTAVEIQADNVFFVGGKGQGVGAGNTAQAQPDGGHGEFEEVDVDDMPF